jgi:uncharacterized protein
MTRIGLLSDTHGYLDPKILHYFKACDEVWHAGDFGGGVIEQLESFRPLRGVFGNIDGQEARQRFPETLRFKCEDADVLIKHIGGYPGHYDISIKSEIENNPPKLFICGHSHILKVVRDKKHNNLLHINPGAAGTSGFHKVRTIVRFAIDRSNIKDLEVIELGSKSS